MSVFHGCGLGGTSLVNANVALRPEPWVLDDPRWPAALRKDRKGLDEGYRRAEEILQPTTYPESYPPLAKIAALERSAAGSLCYRTPINVTFQTGPNHVGVDQQACTGCGDCVTGCNYGAKNTLLMNYLPDAVAHGAHIFTEVDVRWVEPAGDRWAVRYQPLGVGRGRFDAPPLTVIGDVVMVGGGTMGSNEVLLRSRAHGLARVLPARDPLHRQRGRARLRLRDRRAGPRRRRRTRRARARPAAGTLHHRGHRRPAGPGGGARLRDRGRRDPRSDRRDRARPARGPRPARLAQGAGSTTAAGRSGCCAAS